MGAHKTTAVTAAIENGGEAYQRFLDILDSKSEQTKLKYIIDFNYYLRFLKLKNPSSLITKRMIDNLKEVRKVQQQIISYLNHLKKQKLSYSTISGRLHAISKFYMANEVSLNLKYISQFLPQHKPARRDEAYTQQDIQKMLEVADERDRVMIYLLTGTGLRVGALCELRIRNLTKRTPEGYPPKTYLYQIMVYEGDRAQYSGFTTFEAAKAIDEYLTYRERFGEKLKPDSPLLRDKFNSTIPGGAEINRPMVLNVRTFQSQIDRILRSSGLRAGTKKEEKHLHKQMATHGCRKFYDTQMLKAKVDFNVKENLMGHRKSIGLDFHYDRTTWEDRLKEFLPAIELLTISPENRLRRQVQEQEHTIQVQMVEKDRQIQELMSRQDQLEAMLADPEQYIRMRNEAMGRREEK